MLFSVEFSAKSFHFKKKMDTGLVQTPTGSTDMRYYDREPSPTAGDYDGYRRGVEDYRRREEEHESSRAESRDDDRERRRSYSRERENRDDRSRDRNRNDRKDRDSRRYAPYSRDGEGGGRRSKRQVAGKDCRVYVKNIPFELRWQELKDVMRSGTDKILLQFSDRVYS